MKCMSPRKKNGGWMAGQWKKIRFQRFFKKQLETTEGLLLEHARKNRMRLREIHSGIRAFSNQPMRPLAEFAPVHAALSFFVPEWWNKKIIHVGAGAGEYCAYLKKIGANVMAIDSNQEYLRMGRPPAEKGAVRATVQQLPLAHATGRVGADVIVSDRFLFSEYRGLDRHTNKGSRKALREIHRVLKPGGFLILECWSHGTIEPYLDTDFSEAGFRIVGRTRKTTRHTDAGLLHVVVLQKEAPAAKK